MYLGNFSEWLDVRREYHNDGAKYGEYEKDSPVPEEVQKVIFAAYFYENYEGSSVVIYYDKNHYWLNEGGHCSCYGLENQWGPVEYNSAKLFKAAVMDRSYGLLHDNKDEILKAIDEFEFARTRRRTRQ